MAYEVRIHREALKFYKSLPAEWRLRIDQAVEKLRQDPWRSDLDIKRLHGEHKGYFRLRLGTVRLVYTVDPEKGQIYIDALGYRGSVY
ncbi:MAG: type II toxin-antitoxin system RelE family toxin [Bacillota bacterium]